MLLNLLCITLLQHAMQGCNGESKESFEWRVRKHQALTGNECLRNLLNGECTSRSTSSPSIIFFIR